MTNRAGIGAAFRVALCGVLSVLIEQACSDSTSHRSSPSTDAGTRDAGMQARADGSSKGSGGASSDGSAGPGKGACKAGAAACLGNGIVRVCSPEGDWVTVPCAPGETCTSGLCSTPQACKPGEKTCATDGAAKVCDNDGSAWVVAPCANGKICTAGVCVVDVTGAECTPGVGQCLDGKTRLRCLPGGRGFESFDCPATAPCVNGECRGSVCTLGESTCDFNGKSGGAVRTCVAGTSFSETPCPDNSGSCQVTTDASGRAKAVCSAQTSCGFPGNRVCGDATNPAIDTRLAFSQCTQQPDGSLSWVRVDCASPATCDPSIVGCTSTCAPGEKRCVGETGYQVCGTDGTWLPLQLCNTGATTGLSCRATPSGLVTSDGGAFADVQCVERICALVSTGGTVGGFDGGPPVSIAAGSDVCDGVQVRKCSADGKLEPAQDCAAGACRATGSAMVAGYRPGSCSADCTAGEQRCLTDGLPLYLSCAADGTWSSTYQSCGSSCQTAIDANGKRTALCGGQCLPGALRCDGDKLQKCGDGRTWLPSTACTAGRCTEVTGGALCQADCVPGSVVCAGTEKDASDGISRGTSGTAVCSAQGLLPTTVTDCAGTETCRTSHDGAATGCVECIGPSVHGGNDVGLVDSRCAQSSGSVQTCGTGNDWDAATSCGSGSSCFIGVPKSCGACPPSPFFFIPGQCTQTALSQSFGSSCQNFGFGAPGICGTVNDCCGAACTASGGAFAFCAPSDFSLCLASADLTPLDSAAPQRTTGTTLFGDDTLSPSCAARAGSPDTAFSFTAPRSGTFAFDTFGSSIDTVLYALDFVGCNELACSDDALGTLTSRIFLDLVGGQQIIVMVEGLGDFNLNVVDTSVATCGNGFVDPGEACDGSDFGGQTCLSATLGTRPGGQLLCAANCTFDTSGCTGGGGGGTGGGTGTGGSNGKGASPSDGG